MLSTRWHLIAVRLRPDAGSTLAVNFKHARDTTDALARIFARPRRRARPTSARALPVTDPR